MSSQEKLMIVLRAKERPRFPSQGVRCKDCGEDCWCANTSYQAAMDQCVAFVCMECFAKWMDKEKPGPSDLEIKALTTKAEYLEFMEAIHKDENWEGH